MRNKSTALTNRFFKGYRLWNYENEIDFCIMRPNTYIMLQQFPLLTNLATVPELLKNRFCWRCFRNRFPLIESVRGLLSTIVLTSYGTLSFCGRGQGRAWGLASRPPWISGGFYKFFFGKFILLFFRMRKRLKKSGRATRFCTKPKAFLATYTFFSRRIWVSSELRGCLNATFTKAGEEPFPASILSSVKA